MSNWLSGLAGKAEDMLNKLDQNAATVLQQQKFEDENLLLEVKSDENVVKIKPNNNEQPNNKSIMILSKSSPNLSPKKQTELLVNSEIKTSNNNNNNNSHSNRSGNSSRQSSFSGLTIIEKNITTPQQTNNVSGTNIENELAAVKIVLAEIKSERDELKSELESLNEQLKSANNQTRLIELETINQKLIADFEALQENNNGLKNSNIKYIKSISELETTISKLHQSEMELNEKLQWAQSETDQAITELKQYRSRAQVTLQVKEKIIAQLSNGDTQNSIKTSINENNILELEQLKVENDNLNSLVVSLKNQIDQIKMYNTKIEDKHRDFSEQIEQKMEHLQESFKLEQRRCRQYEDDIKLQNQEMTTVREEMIRFRTTTSKKMHEKEAELSKLKNKLSQRGDNAISNGLEERLHSLTQSLVQKQTSLEKMTAERNAKKLQLEKLENQHRTAMLQLRQHRPQIVNVNDTDDAKAEVPNFLQENPFDKFVARRVKRAYSSLDSVSIRLGVFLRRFPLIRIFVIIYVVLLHLWVIFVLLSSTPN